MANVYRIKGDYATAADWYKQVVKDTANASAEDYLYYAQTLRYVEEYNSAQENIQIYKKLKPEDPRAKLLDVSFEDLKPLITDSAKYGVQSLSFNNEAQEFSPAFYKDRSIIFPSSRNEETKIDKRWYEVPYLDLYISEKSDTGNAKPYRLDSKVNNRYHEGPLTFDTTFSKMYFTRNNYVKRKQETGEGDIMRLKIFSAKAVGVQKDSSGKEQIEWGEIEELPFNSDDYSIGHPTLSVDAKYLYFSSDMPGGFGGLDLYKIEVKEDGSFGEAENLGADINTPGDESFPFIHQDGTLYFASDARKGLGGLDIYYSKKTDGKWSEPENMGYPINTNFDDFGLIMNKEKDGGYLSSNRSGKYVDDDIFSFNNRGLLLKGYVYDLFTEARIDSADVYLVEKGDTLEQALSNDKGEFQFWVAANATYVLGAFEPNYNPNQLTCSTDSVKGNLPVLKIPLDKGGLKLAGKVVEAGTGDPIPNAMVLLDNIGKKTLDTFYSDPEGFYTFLIEPDQDYILSAEKYAWFLTSEEEVNTAGVPVPSVVERDLEMTRLETGAIIKLVNIYYDFDKYNIRPDAAKELDRVAEFLAKYPELVIQLRSHTDCRATDPYNMWLSARRAESAANYLLKNGSRLNQLTVVGFGENQLVNACFDEAECTESQHQENRRTEFKVIVQPNTVKIKGSVL